MRKAIALLVLGLILGVPLAQAADVERNETVYVSLDNHGQPLDVRVVTWLRGDPEAETWTDYGRYDTVESTSADIAPSIGDGTITWPVSAMQGEGLFYQGTTSADLPIKLQISYYLNGEQIEPEQLAGASGEVQIKLQVQNRLRQEQVLSYRGYDHQPAESKQTLYTPLVVQVTQALPVGTWSEIQADGATRVLAGDQLRLSWALFPYPRAEFSLKMQGQQISLAPLEINVLPMMPPLPDLGAAAQLQQLVAGVDQLSASLQQLASAADGLASGQAQAVGGGQQLAAGLGELLQAVQSAETGAKSLAEGLSRLQSSHLQLATASTRLQQSGDPYLQSLATGLAAEAEALEGLASGGQSLAGGIAQLSTAISALSQETAGLFIGAEQLTNGQQALAEGLHSLLAQGVSPMREQAISQYAAAELGSATTGAMQRLVDQHHSFVDNSRNQIGQVQYLLRTKGVPLPIVEQEATPPVAALSLWQRIVRFFTGK